MELEGEIIKKLSNRWMMEGIVYLLDRTQQIASDSKSEWPDRNIGYKIGMSGMDRLMDHMRW